MQTRFKSGGEWIHVVPRGDYPHPSGILQILDEEALSAILTHFEEDSARPNFPGVLIDTDHFSDQPDKPSEAAGWIDQLEVRADGIWGRARWSDLGEAAVNGGRYRLVSPVFTGVNIGNTRFRPVRLLKAALTNDPNLKGMVPLSNRQTKGHTMTAQDPRARARLQAAEVETFRMANRCTHQEAWNSVRRLKPELFSNTADPSAGAAEAWQRDRPAVKTHEGSAAAALAHADARAADKAAAAAASGKGGKAYGEAMALMAGGRLRFSQAWEAVRATKPELFE